MTGGDRDAAAGIAHSQILRLAADVRCGTGDLIVIEQQSDQAIVPVPAKLGNIPDVVNCKDVSLVEVRNCVIKGLVRTAVVHIVRVIVSIVKRLRVSVCNTVLKALV